MMIPLLHLGMLIVGVPYSVEGMLHTEARGGTPYGATTIAGGQGELQPKPEDLAIARALGRRVAEITAKYALDQLASGTSGRLQGGRVSSDVHVLRLGLGTGSRQHLATPQNICEESRSTRTWNGSFQPYYLLHHSDRKR
jgi:hypothetical protein